MLILVASPTRSGEGSLLVNLKRIWSIRLDMADIKTNFRLGIFSNEFY